MARRRAARPRADRAHLYAIATIAIPAGAFLFFAGLFETLPIQPQAGASTFFGGCFFAGFAYALRKLQLIEWRLEKAARASTS